MCYGKFWTNGPIVPEETVDSSPKTVSNFKIQKFGYSGRVPPLFRGPEVPHAPPLEAP